MAAEIVLRVRLSVLIVAALVFANIQCAAFCAVESCATSGTSATPVAGASSCHQHHTAPGKPTPAPCGHQVVVQADTAQAAVTLVFTASVVVMDLPAGPLAAFTSLPGVETLAARAPSPPGLSLPSSVVLRL
jgi:hypothetical protein